MNLLILLSRFFVKLLVLLSKKLYNLNIFLYHNKNITTNNCVYQIIALSLHQNYSNHHYGNIHYYNYNNIQML